jgi:hypothetical protein
MAKWKRELQELSLGGLSHEEYDQFKTSYGNVSADKLNAFALKKNILFPSGSTTTTTPTYQGGGTTTTSGDTTTSGNASGIAPSGYATNLQNQYDYELGLINAQGEYSVRAADIAANAQLSSTQTRAEADKEINRARTEADRYAAELGLKGIESQTSAQRYLGELGLKGTQLQTDAQRYLGELGLQGTQLQTDAQRYLGELGLQGTKYSADKESEWRKAVAGIEVEGRLNLQPIINAGLARVAEIEGAAARDVAETTGRYSLESMRTRSEADKAIGKMQLAGAQYGLIGSVFG